MTTNHTQPEAEVPFKVYKIEPAADDRVDSIYVKAGGSWSEAMSHAEDSLDRQFSDGIPWDEIKVTIKCGMMTQSQWNDLEPND